MSAFAGSKQLNDSQVDWVEINESNQGGASLTTFLDLDDTPSTYSGDALDVLRVNAGATAVEFVAPSVIGAGTHIGETPSGTINGVNATFTLTNSPSPTTNLKLFINGINQRPGAAEDFTLSGATITFVSASIPETGDTIIAFYIF